MTMRQQHPLSALYPAMSEDEYAALLASITDIGVQNPITLYDGQVLDGWNRYRAATELGYECPSVEFAGEDPARFVLAQNGARRNLTASQRAFAAAACFQWRPVGRPNSEVTSELRSQAEVATAAKVSDTTLRQAKRVVDLGAPELQAAVRDGATSVEVAAEIARLPKEEQAAALHAPKPSKFRGKPKKGPKADAIRAALKAAAAKDQPADPAGDEAPPPAPEYSELDAARDQIVDLQAALALASMGDVSEEDRSQAKELIGSLQSEVKSLNAQLAAIKQSRDFLMAENAQMKQQMAAQRREIDRLKNPKGHAAGL